MSRALLSIIATSCLLSLSGCIESTGACITEDGARSYCFEDEDEGMCSDFEDSFHADSSCAAVGYPYHCTHEDMRESGSPDGYFVARYLDNPSCNPYGSSGGGGSGGGGGGTSCAQCEYGTTCVDAEGSLMCLDECSSDSDCPDSCCLSIEGGGAACAPSYDWCGGGGGGGNNNTNNGGGSSCDDYTSCIEVVEMVNDEPCGNPQGATARIRNNCSHDVHYSFCLQTDSEYADDMCLEYGNWECWSSDISAGATDEQWACVYTGYYKVVATRTSSDGGDPYGCLDGCANWD